jgi:SAM-dependent methyltransferase
MLPPAFVCTLHRTGAISGVGLREASASVSMRHRNTLDDLREHGGSERGVTGPERVDPYEAVPDLGTLYDAVPLYAARNDVAYYTALARESSGAVLEVGCGTGRVLLPMARATTQQVTGIDGSPAMLKRCADKLTRETSSVRDRVALQIADITQLSTAGEYGLIVAPFRVMQHLTTVDAQLDFLRSVARLLAPAGQFVFDVFNPKFSLLLMDRSSESEDVAPTTLADGRVLSRSARIVRVRWLEQLSETELIYYVSERAGDVPRRLVQAFDMRWYLRWELEHLLARAGLEVVTIHGDFDEAPLTDDAPEMVVECRHARTSR